MNDTKEQLEKSISLAKYRLKQFTKEMLESEGANLAYNKLLIEKAILTQKLRDAEENKIKKFWNKLIRKATGKKLISDYF